MSGTLSIKGIREGLLVTLGGITWAVALEELLAHIDSQGDFFLGARVAMHLGEHEPRAADLAEARSRLAKRGLTMWAVLSESPAVVRSAKSLGLATDLPAPPAFEAPFAMDSSIGASVRVSGVVHAGERIECAGHIVILGDVEAGALVVAAGDIIVWGALRGTAHAGAAGDSSAVVCALDLSPAKLSIAGDQAGEKLLEQADGPATARREGEAIVVEEWHRPAAFPKEK